MKKIPAPSAKAALLRPISACSAALAKPTLERSIIARANIRARNGSSFQRHLARALSISASCSTFFVFSVMGSPDKGSDKSQTSRRHWRQVIDGRTQQREIGNRRQHGHACADQEGGRERAGVLHAETGDDGRDGTGQVAAEVLDRTERDRKSVV